MVSETIPRKEDEAWIQRPTQGQRKRPKGIRRKTLFQEEERQIKPRRRHHRRLVSRRTMARRFLAWSWDYAEESYAAKCKGKKGKRGKGKGKYGKDGKDGKGGSKDGVANLADAAQGSASTAATTTFFVDHSNFYNLSFIFMATENHEAFITQPLTPTSMVLDLGCTRAMTSRVAAQDMMKFCGQNKDCGAGCHTAETQSQFTFANSESTKCRQKLIICMYDREFSVQSTKFDIAEQGHVPTLMALRQM